MPTQNICNNDYIIDVHAHNDSNDNYHDDNIDYNNDSHNNIHIFSNDEKNNYIPPGNDDNT